MTGNNKLLEQRPRIIETTWARERQRREREMHESFEEDVRFIAREMIKAAAKRRDAAAQKPFSRWL